MGGDLQWGKVCNGFSVPLQIFRGEGLQWGGGGLKYNTGQGIGSNPLKSRIFCFVIFRVHHSSPKQIELKSTVTYT